MTQKTLRKLPAGTQVGWDSEPQARGVVEKKPYLCIRWTGGQITYDFDDWALQHVRVLTGEMVSLQSTENQQAPSTGAQGEAKSSSVPVDPSPTPGGDRGTGEKGGGK